MDKSSEVQFKPLDYVIWHGRGVFPFLVVIVRSDGMLVLSDQNGLDYSVKPSEVSPYPLLFNIRDLLEFAEYYRNGLTNVECATRSGAEHFFSWYTFVRNKR